MLEVGEKQKVLLANDNNEYVLVRVAEIEELIEQIDEQPTWATGLKWLSNQTGGRSSDWLKDNILFPPRNRKILEDFVDYPDGNTRVWSFHIKEMRNWLNNKGMFRRVHDKNKKAPSAKGAK